MTEHYLKAELYNFIKHTPDYFDFIQKGSLDGIWYWDLEYPEHEWMSEEFWHLLGFDPQEKEHLASEWQDLIFTEDLERAKENLEKHLADPNHPYDQVVRYRHKLGKTIWVRCRGIAIRDPETGKPLRMLGAHNDLTPLMASKEMTAALLFQIDALKMQISTKNAKILVLEAKLKASQNKVN